MKSIIKKRKLQSVMKNNRILISTALGAVLGIFCIIGVSGRIPISGNELFFVGMWYNRVILGFVIGLSADLTITQNEKLNPVIRGALLGFFIALAILLSSQAKDVMSFFAGIGYGVIIDVLVTWYL